VTILKIGGVVEAISSALLNREHLIRRRRCGFKIEIIGVARQKGMRCGKCKFGPDRVGFAGLRNIPGRYLSPLDQRTVGLFQATTRGSIPLTRASRIAAEVSDRLINYPTPPRELDPAISPQLQEIIYRALERNPANRYASAGEFAKDLNNLASVGVADRDELRDWKSRRSSQPRTILKYVMLAMIPVIIFILLLITARHN